MASLLRSTTRHISLGGALLAGLVISTSSARAEPPPAAFTPLPAPTPQALPMATPAASPPRADTPRPPELVAPVVRYPAYFYVPSAEVELMHGMPTKRVWYGWQTLLVLGSSASLGLATGLGGAASGADGLGVFGLSVGGAGLLFGGPIVHWAHGNIGKGFGALGLNLGVPIVSGGVGVAIACGAGGCRNSANGFGIFFGLLIGGSLGSIAATVIDVTALSYEQSVPVASTASRRAPGWTLVPDLQITREKTTFGFAGAF